MFDPNTPDFEAQNAALQQQQQLADFMRKKAAAAQQPTGRMVGGRYIRPHLLEQLVPMLQQLQAGQADRSVAAQQQALGQAQDQHATQWRAALPQATAGREGYGANEMDNEAVPAKIGRASCRERV